MNPDESFQAGIRAREIRSLFAEIAVHAGVSRPGDPIDQMQVDFAAELLALCAWLVDRYPNPECIEDTIGNVLGGKLFEL
jgi:hypothetical protein